MKLCKKCNTNPVKPYASQQLPGEDSVYDAFCKPCEAKKMALEIALWAVIAYTAYMLSVLLKEALRL